jgi:hypothetical protein
VSRRRLHLAAGVVLAVLAAPAAAEDSVSALLGTLAPGLGASPRVEITARLDPQGPDPALLVRLEPAAGTRLVADPGVSVTLADRAAPVTWALPGQDYFSTPPEVRIPVVDPQAQGPWPIRVEYAYCVVERQCLFGEATLLVAATGTARVCAAGTEPVPC